MAGQREERRRLAQNVKGKYPVLLALVGEGKRDEMGGRSKVVIEKG